VIDAQVNDWVNFCFHPTENKKEKEKCWKYPSTVRRVARGILHLRKINTSCKQNG
jgi:hypothetical protein